MIFDKEFFKKNAPKYVQKILSSHIDALDDKKVTFQDNDRFGTVEYQEEGQDFELYPVYPDWCREELKVCKDNLDKKVNEDETLREFIKNSYKEFYEVELCDEIIDSWSEAQLVAEVEHLDYLWTK